ncbi:MAG: CDP-glycerol glycerophosphotransferase family protein [Candidatus Margulisiibacteriota bacterium]
MIGKETMLNARSKYIDFIYRWPKEYTQNGKDFRQLFLLDGGLSLWWASEMHKKEIEDNGLFQRLCELEAGQKISVVKISGLNLLKDFIPRLKFVVKMAVRVILIRIFVGVKREKAKTLFYTLFGIISNGTPKGLFDRYLFDIPERTAKASGENALCFSFYYGSIKKIISDREILKKSGVVFLENYIGIRDLIDSLGAGQYVRYYFMEKNDLFQKSFDYYGADLSFCFKPQLRKTYAGEGFSEMLLLTRSCGRMFKSTGAKVLVSSHETYPQSRVLFYEAKKLGVYTYALQHASITPMKLWYAFSPSELSEGMPVSDAFIFQGEMGRRVLIEGGYPEIKSFVLGSPRSDKLFYLKQEGIETELPKNKKIVLVTTVLSTGDTKAIIEAVVRVAAKRKDLHFCIKPHPNCPVAGLLDEKLYENISESHDNVHQLILRSNVLVTTYSITADEAIALGCPVICLRTDSIIDMSSFFEVPAAPYAASVDELETFIDEAALNTGDFPSYRRNWPQLIKDTFFLLDGKATQRIVNLIALNDGSL